MPTLFCKKCGLTLDEKEFYTSKDKEKHPPSGKLDMCKKCITMHVDNWDPETYKWILEEIDVPYIKEEWDSLLAKFATDPKKITGMSIMGRYLSKMKLKQWSKYHWADTERIAEEIRQKKILAMKAQGLSGEEIDEQLAIDHTPPKPEDIPVSMAAQVDLHLQQQGGISAPVEIAGMPQDEFEDDLTEEDKKMLRLKWGRSYRADEWVRLEQLYNDMMRSYDIQGAGHKDTLIMICKASLKANQLIDAGDKL